MTNLEPADALSEKIFFQKCQQWFLNAEKTITRFDNIKNGMVDMVVDIEPMDKLLGCFVADNETFSSPQCLGRSLRMLGGS
jgi:hypothetical protein